MPDAKISELAVAGALTGVEKLPFTQSGVNVAVTASQLRDYCRIRQDCMMVGSIAGVTGYWNLNNRPVLAAAGVYYTFFRGDADGDLHCTTSTNYGVTWAVPTGQFLIKAGTITHFAVWFDKWTPGDNGNIIHMCYGDEVLNTFVYRTLDTSNNTLGSEVPVASVAVNESSSTCLSITKTRAGRIVIAYDGDGVGGNGCVKSDQYPVSSFSAINNGLHEGAVSDYYALFPGNEADTADFCAGFWDRSAAGLSIKTYDDSANTWSEVSVGADGTMSHPAVSSSTNWSIATRLTDNHAILVAWNGHNNAGLRLRTWDITNGTTIAARADVIASSAANQFGAAVSLDGASEITTYYVGKNNGSESSTRKVYKKKSTDAGASWGAETAVSDVLRPLAHVLAAPNHTASDHLVVTIGSEFASANFRCRALS